MSEKGKLFMLPGSIGGGPEFIPEHTVQSVKHIRHFVAEHEKNARRYLMTLKKMDHPVGEWEFFPLNKHTDLSEVRSYLSPLKEGLDMAMVSDAGCPGIADPGAMVARIAHEMGAEVVPLVGPSSLFLCLMASGFNGQQFAFHGYLPKDKSPRRKKLKEFERESQQKNQSQIFIETPYRNMHMLSDIKEFCDSRTLLCIGVDLNTPSQQVISQPVGDWKKTKIDLAKRPAVFILYSGEGKM